MSNIPGNQDGTKLKDPEVRQEAYRQYCAHLASGYPKEAFFFDHPTHSVCWKTMDRYIRENPAEFPAIKMEKAMATRYKHWLDEGKKLMEGKYKNGSPVTWNTFMRNMFAWGIKEGNPMEYNEETLNSFDGLMKMFQAAQSSRKMLDSNKSEL